VKKPRAHERHDGAGSSEHAWQARSGECLFYKRTCPISTAHASFLVTSHISRVSSARRSILNNEISREEHARTSCGQPIRNHTQKVVIHDIVSYAAD
jgi:hypothetical protein